MLAWATRMLQLFETGMGASTFVIGFCPDLGFRMCHVPHRPTCLFVGRARPRFSRSVFPS